MKYYLAREGVAFGPYTEFQVRESVRLGIFERGDLALAEDGQEWSTVAQLLPVAADNKTITEPPAAKLAPEEPLAVVSSAPVQSQAIEAGPLAPRMTIWSPWRLAWAVPVVLLICIAGTWSASRRRVNPALPALRQATNATKPVETVKPVPAPRPPVDDMALPTRENLPGTPTQASTVANPIEVLTSSAQKAETAEELTKVPGPQHIIEGQINIAARNGRTYEPSAVEVKLYPIATLRPYLEKRGLEANARYDELGEKMKAIDAEKENLRKVSDAAFDAYAASDREAPNRRDLEVASTEAKQAREKAANEYYNLRQEREDILSGAFYLEELPPAASIARTDSQGKFRLTVPDDGDFAIVAGTQRNGDEVERYYWFVPLNLAGEPSKTILLSNNNTTAHGSAESLVQTVD